MAITEDESEISLRDANSSRERPKLDGFDMDEDVVKEIEVSFEFEILNLYVAIKGRVLFQR